MWQEQSVIGGRQCPAHAGAWLEKVCHIRSGVSVGSPELYEPQVSGAYTYKIRRCCEQSGKHITLKYCNNCDNYKNDGPSICFSYRIHQQEWLDVTYAMAYHLHSSLGPYVSHGMCRLGVVLLDMAPDDIVGDLIKRNIAPAGWVRCYGQIWIGYIEEMFFSSQWIWLWGNGIQHTFSGAMYKRNSWGVLRGLAFI